MRTVVAAMAGEAVLENGYQDLASYYFDTVRTISSGVCLKKFFTKMFLNYFTLLMYENWVPAAADTHAHPFDPR